MTLEKLLIFGFALAALLAVTTLGNDMFGKRNDANNTIQSEFEGFGS